MPLSLNPRRKFLEENPQIREQSKPQAAPVLDSQQNTKLAQGRGDLQESVQDMLTAKKDKKKWWERALDYSKGASNDFIVDYFSGADPQRKLQLKSEVMNYDPEQQRLRYFDRNGNELLNKSWDEMHWSERLQLANKEILRGSVKVGQAAGQWGITQVGNVGAVAEIYEQLSPSIKFSKYVQRKFGIKVKDNPLGRKLMDWANETNAAINNDFKTTSYDSSKDSIWNKPSLFLNPEWLGTLVGSQAPNLVVMGGGSKMGQATLTGVKGLTSKTASKLGVGVVSSLMQSGELMLNRREKNLIKDQNPKAIDALFSSSLGTLNGALDAIGFDAILGSGSSIGKGIAKNIQNNVLKIIVNSGLGTLTEVTTESIQELTPPIVEEAIWKERGSMKKAWEEAKQNIAIASSQALIMSAPLSIMSSSQEVKMEQAKKDAGFNFGIDFDVDGAKNLAATFNETANDFGNYEMAIKDGTVTEESFFENGKMKTEVVERLTNDLAMKLEARFPNSPEIGTYVREGLANNKGYKSFDDFKNQMRVVVEGAAPKSYRNEISRSLNIASEKTGDWQSFTVKGASQFNNALEQVSNNGKEALSLQNVSPYKIAYDGFVEADFEGDPKALRALKDVEKGNYKPVIIQETDGRAVVVDGNHHLWAYKKKGIKNIPVITTQENFKNTNLSAEIVAEQQVAPNEQQIENNPQVEEMVSVQDFGKTIEALPKNILDSMPDATSRVLTEDEVNSFTETEQSVLTIALEEAGKTGQFDSGVIGENIQQLNSTPQAQGSEERPVNTKTQNNTPKAQVPEANVSTGDMSEMANQLASINANAEQSASGKRQATGVASNILQGKINDFVKENQDIVSQVKGGKGKEIFNMGIAKLGKKSYASSVSMNGSTVDIQSNFSSSKAAGRGAVRSAVIALESGRGFASISQDASGDIRDAILAFNEKLGDQKLSPNEIKNAVNEAKSPSAKAKEKTKKGKKDKKTTEKQQKKEKSSKKMPEFQKKKKAETLAEKAKIRKEVVSKHGNLKVQKLYEKVYRKLYKTDPPNSLTAMIKERYSKLVGDGTRMAFVVGKDVAAIREQGKARKALQKSRERATSLLRQTREMLKNLFTLKMSTKQEAMDLAAEYIIMNLPASKRGKFLKALKNVKKGKSLEELVNRVDNERQNYERRLLIKNINKLLDNAHLLPVDIQRTIVAITSKIELKKHTRRFLEKIEKTKEFLEKAGDDKKMPNRVLEQLGILEKTPLEELDNFQLMELNNKLYQYYRVGRAIMRNRAVLIKRDKEKALEAIRKSSKNLDKIPQSKLTPSAKKALSFWDKVKDRAQSADFNLLGMDRLFDILDGNKDYKGANYKIFKEPVDDGWNAWQKVSDETRTPFWRLVKELQLTEVNAERIAIYAYDQQVGGREKLLEFNNLDDKLIDSIKLTPEENKVYELMREKLDELRPLLEETLKNTRNEALGYVNNYFPMMTDFSNATPVVEEIVGDYRMQRVPFGNVKERVPNAKQTLQLNAFEVFDRYIDKATYWTALDETIARLNRFAKDDKYANAVGEKAQKIVLQWLDVLARQGGIANDKSVRLVNTINNNLSIAILGLRLTTIIKQPLALFEGTAEIGSWVFVGSKNVVKRGWRDFMYDASSEMRNRAGGDPALIELEEQKRLKKVQEVAMAGIKATDRLTAGAVWIGAYTQKVTELGISVDFNSPNKEAVQYADHVVRKTQATGNFKDLSPALVNKYKMYNKLWLKFQQFMLNRWGYIRHDVKNNLSKNKVKASRQLTFLMMSVMAEAAINSLYYMKLVKREDDPEELKKNFFENIMAGMAQNIPGVGSLVSSLKYSSNPVPAIESVSKLLNSVKWSVQGKKSGTKVKHAVRSFSYGLGLAGLPTDQARQLIEMLVDFEEIDIEFLDTTKKKGKYEVSKKDKFKVKSDDKYKIK